MSQLIDNTGNDTPVLLADSLLARLRAICGDEDVLTKPIQLQITGHLQRKGRPLPLVHPMELLHRSIAGGGAANGASPRHGVRGAIGWARDRAPARPRRG